MIITPLLVIFLLIVFVLLFLFLNTVDDRKWLTILISVLLTPLVYFYIFYPFINIISNYHHQKYFNAEAWIEKPALRYEMIDSTIDSDTLIGISKSRAQELLGKPEWLSWDDNKKAHNDNLWNYGLGIEPGAFTEEKSNVEIQFRNDKIVNLRPYTEAIVYEEEK